MSNRFLDKKTKITLRKTSSVKIKDDNDDNDELSIFLNEDEYVTGHDETFNSFTHGNSLSLDEYFL